MYMCVCACVGVLSPKTDISAFLYISHLLFETEIILMLGLQVVTAILGFYAWVSCGCQGFELRSCCLCSKHITKGSSPQPFGEDLNFIYLVMAVLLVYLLGFFACLFVCCWRG